MYKFIKIIDDIKAVKALYPEIEEDKFNELIKLDPTFVDGRDSVGTYGKWILNLYKKGNLKEEDFYKIPDYLKDFEKKKKLIQNKDINSYKTLPDLAKALDETDDPTQSKNQLRKAVKRTDLSQNADFIGSFGQFDVYVPKTYEASCKLGANTHWCTASREYRGYFDNYSSSGNLYIFYDRNKNQAEYQFHFESGSFMNKEDSPISLGNFTYKICPEAKEFVIKKIKETNCFDQWKIIDQDQLSVDFLPEIKEILENKKADWEKQSYIEDILQNPYLSRTKEFNKYLLEALEKDNSFALNYILNDDVVNDFSEYIKKALEFDGDIKIVQVKSDILGNYCSSEGNIDKLSSEFIKDLFYGEIWEYFNYSGDYSSASDGEYYLNKENENLLNELHLKYENLNIEDLEPTLDVIVNDACVYGAENECLNDFAGALQDACEDANVNLERVDESTWQSKISFEEYRELCKKYVNEYGEDEYDVRYMDEVISHLIAYNFKFYEPYAGWSDFDEKYFNEEISYILKEIQKGELDPYFDDEEDLEEWKKWFQKEYKIEKEIKPAQGQQEMQLDSVKYIFKDKKDLNYVYKLGFVYKDKNGKLQRKDKYDIREYYEDKYLGKGRFTKAQIYNMIEGADIDCDNYIELHKNDKSEPEWKPKKYKDMSKQEYINYLINSGYSEADAQDKADALYGEDDD